MNTYFTAMIDPNGQILAFEASGQRVVGVITKMYEDTKAQRDKAVSKAEELYKMCVDNGIIKPEPTQEEVLRKALDEIQETRRINEQLVQMIAAMGQSPAAMGQSPAAMGQSPATMNQPPLTVIPDTQMTTNTTPPKSSRDSKESKKGEVK